MIRSLDRLSRNRLAIAIAASLALHVSLVVSGSLTVHPPPRAVAAASDPLQLLLAPPSVAVAQPVAMPEPVVDEPSVPVAQPRRPTRARAPSLWPDTGFELRMSIQADPGEAIHPRFEQALSERFSNVPREDIELADPLAIDYPIALVRAAGPLNFRALVVAHEDGRLELAATDIDDPIFVAALSEALAATRAIATEPPKLRAQVIVIWLEAAPTDPSIPSPPESAAPPRLLGGR